MSTAVIEKEKIFLNTKTQTTEPKMDDESDISYDTDSWQSLMQAKTREFHAISEAENEKKKSLYLQEKIKKLESDCALLRNATQNRQNDIIILQEIEQNLEKRCSRQETEIQKLINQYSHLEAQLKEREEFYLKQIKTMETKCQEAQQLLETTNETKTQQEATSKEMEELRKSLETQSTELETREKLVNSKSTQLNRQEEKLRRYSITLNQSKIQLKELSIQLAKEIENAQTLHPLKDYLSITEFELSNLEAQLIKTPTSSPERPTLESYATQMIDQRNFLRSLLDNSEKQLQLQASTLEKITHPEKLVSCPPPPPFSKKISST